MSSALFILSKTPRVSASDGGVVLPGGPSVRTPPARLGPRARRGPRRHTRACARVRARLCSGVVVCVCASDCPPLGRNSHRLCAALNVLRDRVGKPTPLSHDICARTSWSRSSFLFSFFSPPPLSDPVDPETPHKSRLVSSAQVCRRWPRRARHLFRAKVFPCVNLYLLHTLVLFLP